MDEDFFASEVTKITGVKLNRLQPWMERGFIEPSIQKATGHGTRNIFSRDDLYKIQLFKEMVEKGISRKLAAENLSIVAWSEIEEKSRVKNLWIAICQSYLEGEVRGVSRWITFPEKYAHQRSSSQPVPSRNAKFIEKTMWDLLPGADEVMLINFSKIKERVDKKIEEVRG